jgi:hypothetical protein
MESNKTRSQSQIREVQQTKLTKQKAYHKYPHSQIPPTHQPKRPTRQPPIPIVEREWDDRFSKDFLQHRTVIAPFDDPSQGDRQLHIPDLLQADSNRILQRPSEQEKRGGVF